MADLSLTATSIAKGSDAVTEQGILGATVTAGQVVYKDPADGLYKLADTNGADANIRTAWGIALNGGASGQPVLVQRSGSITLGSVLTQGGVYVLSATPGGIAPVADLAAGHYTTTLGIATSASALALQIQNSGAVRS